MKFNAMKRHPLPQQQAKGTEDKPVIFLIHQISPLNPKVTGTQKSRPTDIDQEPSHCRHPDRSKGQIYPKNRTKYNDYFNATDLNSEANADLLPSTLLPSIKKPTQLSPDPLKLEKPTIHCVNPRANCRFDHVTVTDSRSPDLKNLTNFRQRNLHYLKRPNHRQFRIYGMIKQSESAIGALNRTDEALIAIKTDGLDGHTGDRRHYADTKPRQRRVHARISLRLHG